MHRPLSAIATLLAGSASAIAPAFGGGFQIPSHGARGAGQADAYTAQADDPSAVYYNPAGLTQLRGTQVTAGLFGAWTDFEFSGPSGRAESNVAAYVPHFYSATDLHSDRWRFGLGVNNLFGLSESFGDSGPLAASVTHDDLAVISFAPVVAYELDPHVSVALGPNIYYGNIELNNLQPLPAPVGTGAFRFQGEDTAIGGTAGILWKIDPRHAVGAVYRSSFRLDFDGSARIYPGAPGAGVGLPTIGPSDADASVDFPQTAAVGYAYRPREDLKLEVGVQWTDWETLDQVTLRSDDPGLSALPPIRLDYNSSFIYRLGAEYQIARSWTLRAGYAFNQSATPDHTFTPIVVDLDSHIFAAGVGYSQDRWAVDLAYRYIVSDDRNITSSINSPPGEYSDRAHAVMLSVTWRF